MEDIQGLVSAKHVVGGKVVGKSDKKCPPPQQSSSISIGYQTHFLYDALEIKACVLVDWFTSLQYMSCTNVEI